MTNIPCASQMSASCADLGADQQEALNAVRDQAKALNMAIARAVEAGLIVEVNRMSRCHNGQAAWGDQIAPIAQHS